MQVRFGTFVLDSETRELLNAGRPVPLSPNAVSTRSALSAVSCDAFEALIRRNLAFIETMLVASRRSAV
jgi:hypothetical protein